MEKAAFQLGEGAREEVLNKLPKESLLPNGLELGSDVSTVPEKLLTPEQLRITSLDCTDLLSEIAAGRLTALAAMTAFGMRTAIAHQVVSLRRVSCRAIHADSRADQLPDRLLP